MRITWRSGTAADSEWVHPAEVAEAGEVGVRRDHLDTQLNRQRSELCVWDEIGGYAVLPDELTKDLGRACCRRWNPYRFRLEP